MKLVSKSTYKDLCGLTSIHTIYKRIEKGEIVVTIKALPDGSLGEFIDTDKYPPIPSKKRGVGRKTKEWHEQNKAL